MARALPCDCLSESPRIVALVTIPAEDASGNTTRFQVVVNWFDELRDWVPVDN